MCDWVHRRRFGTRVLDLQLTSPCCCQQQEHRGRVEKQRDYQDEIPKDGLIGSAEQRGEIFHRPEVSLDDATLALHLALLELQVGEGLRLDVSLSARLLRLACRRSSSAVRSFDSAPRPHDNFTGFVSLETGEHAAERSAPNDDAGRREKVARASRADLACRAPERQLL